MASRSPSGGSLLRSIGFCYLACGLAAVTGVPLWAIIATAELNLCNVQGFGCVVWFLIGVGLAVVLALVGGRLFGRFLKLRLSTLLFCVVGLLGLIAFGSRFGFGWPLITLFGLWPVLGGLWERYRFLALVPVLTLTAGGTLATVWLGERPTQQRQRALLGAESVTVYGPPDDSRWRYGLVTENLQADGITYRAQVDQARLEVGLSRVVDGQPAVPGETVVGCADNRRCLRHQDTVIELRVVQGTWAVERQDALLRTMTRRDPEWLATRQLPLHRFAYDLSH